MIVEIEKVSTEKWEVSPCKCGEDPEVFDRKTNYNDGHARQVVIHCPECGREATAAYRYQYSEVDFLKARYKAMMQAIVTWENL